MFDAGWGERLEFARFALGNAAFQFSQTQGRKPESVQELVQTGFVFWLPGMEHPDAIVQDLAALADPAAVGIFAALEGDTIRIVLRPPRYGRLGMNEVSAVYEIGYSPVIRRHSEPARLWSVVWTVARIAAANRKHGRPLSHWHMMLHNVLELGAVRQGFFQGDAPTLETAVRFRIWIDAGETQLSAYMGDPAMPMLAYCPVAEPGHEHEVGIGSANVVSPQDDPAPPEGEWSLLLEGWLPLDPPVTEEWVPQHGSASWEDDRRNRDRRYKGLHEAWSVWAEVHHSCPTSPEQILATQVFFHATLGLNGDPLELRVLDPPPSKTDSPAALHQRLIAGQSREYVGLFFRGTQMLDWWISRDGIELGNSAFNHERKWREYYLDMAKANKPVNEPVATLRPRILADLKNAEITPERSAALAMEFVLHSDQLNERRLIAFMEEVEQKLHWYANKHGELPPNWQAVLDQFKLISHQYAMVDEWDPGPDQMGLAVAINRERQLVWFILKPTIPAVTFRFVRFHIDRQRGTVDAKRPEPMDVAGLTEVDFEPFLNATLPTDLIPGT